MATPMLIPNHLLNDLIKFIYTYYSDSLPNSLLIAQAFILKHQNYGREYGLSEINRIIEDAIKQGLFKSVIQKRNKKKDWFKNEFS